MSPLVEAQVAFLSDASFLIQFIHTMAGYTCTAGELYRTAEQQAIYVKEGKSKTQVSQHQNRLAIDLNIFYDGRLATHEEIKVIGKHWEDMDPRNRWGGSWRGLVESGKSTFIDSPHFERMFP